jgi:hypothetical protein
VGFLFVGFVGCVLLLFFLWVSLFVCLFCFAQGEGQEEKKAGVFWWVVLFSGRMAKASWLVMGFIILFQFIAFGLALGAIARRSKVSFFFHKHIYVSGVFCSSRAAWLLLHWQYFRQDFFPFPAIAAASPNRSEHTFLETKCLHVLNCAASYILTCLNLDS